MLNINEEYPRQTKNTFIFILVMLTLGAICIISGFILSAYQEHSSGFVVLFAGVVCYLFVVLATLTINVQNYASENTKFDDAET